MRPHFCMLPAAKCGVTLEGKLSGNSNCINSTVMCICLPFNVNDVKTEGIGLALVEKTFCFFHFGAKNV